MTGVETNAQEKPVVMGKRHQLRTCDVCGKEFITKQSNQIYCSIECQKESKRQRNPGGRMKLRACSRCGGEFEVSVYSKRTLCFECEKVRRKEWSMRNADYVWKPAKEQDWYEPEPEPERTKAPKAALRVDPGRLPKPMLAATKDRSGTNKEDKKEEQPKKFELKFFGSERKAGNHSPRKRM